MANAIPVTRPPVVKGKVEEEVKTTTKPESVKLKTHDAVRVNN
jgi:hypothetical protein